MSDSTTIPPSREGAGSGADVRETDALQVLDGMPEMADRDDDDASDWQEAIADIRAGMARHTLILYLGWDAIREIYQRTIFGPFWLTLSVAVFVLGVGLLFGQILHIRAAAFLPHLATGYLAWLLITGTINDGSITFLRRKNLILSSDMPYSVYVFEIIAKNLISFLFGVPVVAGTMLWYGLPGFGMLLVAVAGLFVIVVNSFSACILLGTVSLRYRDVRETVRTFMRFAFFLTPIIWQPNMLSDLAYLVQFNPFTHFIALVRDPLLGTFPPLISWVVCLLITAAGLAAALTTFTKLRHRIPFWL